jgi:hypothetical protein
LDPVKKLSVVVSALVLGGALLAGCGGSAKNSSPPPPPTSPSTTPPPPPATPPAPPSASGPGALQGEAGSTATGDIPDNQVFLVFSNGAAGYSIKYPEGWAQSGAGSQVTFRDKNNIVRILVRRGAVSTRAAARELRTTKGAAITRQPQATTINGDHAVKTVYSTVSTPNPVTGKRVTLTVDRYYLGRGGKEAIVDLGTPVGVDNVDAYRLMIESFRWR